MIDMKQVKRNPTQYFNRPTDVVHAKGLKKSQRIEILRQWEYDAKQLEVGTEENMVAEENEPDWLQEIHVALYTLGGCTATNPAASKLG